MRALLAASMLAIAAASAWGQAPDAIPPPGDVVETTRPWSLGGGIAVVSWDDDAPYDGLALATASVERSLWSGIRGRGAIAYGATGFRAAGRFGDDVGAETDGATIRVWSLDLQVLVEPAFGPLEGAAVVPYAVGGVGTLVTDYTDAGGLTTRNQSRWSYGGGVRARVGRRFEVRAEVTGAGVRLADPFDVQNRETDTIHNSRWEGQVRWTF